MVRKQTLATETDYGLARLEAGQLFEWLPHAIRARDSGLLKSVFTGITSQHNWFVDRMRDLGRLKDPYLAAAFIPEDRELWREYLSLSKVRFRSQAEENRLHLLLPKLAGDLKKAEFERRVLEALAGNVGETLLSHHPAALMRRLIATAIARSSIRGSHSGLTALGKVLGYVDFKALEIWTRHGITDPAFPNAEANLSDLSYSPEQYPYWPLAGRYDGQILSSVPRLFPGSLVAESEELFQLPTPDPGYSPFVLDDGPAGQEASFVCSPDDADSLAYHRINQRQPFGGFTDRVRHLLMPGLYRLSGGNPGERSGTWIKALHDPSVRYRFEAHAPGTHGDQVYLRISAGADPGTQSLWLSGPSSRIKFKSSYLDLLIGFNASQLHTIYHPVPASEVDIASDLDSLLGRILPDFPVTGSLDGTPVIATADDYQVDWFRVNEEATAQASMVRSQQIPASRTIRDIAVGWSHLDQIRYAPVLAVTQVNLEDSLGGLWRLRLTASGEVQWDPVGDYVPGTQYASGQVLKHSGMVYLVRQPFTAPGSFPVTGVWKALPYQEWGAEMPAEWDPAASYQAGQYCYLQGYVYQALVSSPPGPPSSVLEALGEASLTTVVQQDLADGKFYTWSINPDGRFVALPSTASPLDAPRDTLVRPSGDFSGFVFIYSGFLSASFQAPEQVLESIHQDGTAEEEVLTPELQKVVENPIAELIPYLSDHAASTDRPDPKLSFQTAPEDELQMIPALEDHSSTHLGWAYHAPEALGTDWVGRRRDWGYWDGSFKGRDPRLRVAGIDPGLIEPVPTGHWTRGYPVWFMERRGFFSYRLRHGRQSKLARYLRGSEDRTKGAELVIQVHPTLDGPIEPASTVDGLAPVSPIGPFSSAQIADYDWLLPYRSHMRAELPWGGGFDSWTTVSGTHLIRPRNASGPGAPVAGSGPGGSIFVPRGTQVIAVPPAPYTEALLTVLDSGFDSQGLPWIEVDAGPTDPEVTTGRLFWRTIEFSLPQESQNGEVSTYHPEASQIDWRIYTLSDDGSSFSMQQADDTDHRVHGHIELHLQHLYSAEASLWVSCLTWHPQSLIGLKLHDQLPQWDGLPGRLTWRGGDRNALELTILESGFHWSDAEDSGVATPWTPDGDWRGGTWPDGSSSWNPTRVMVTLDGDHVREGWSAQVGEYWNYIEQVRGADRSAGTWSGLSTGQYYPLILTERGKDQGAGEWKAGEGEYWPIFIIRRASDATRTAWSMSTGSYEQEVFSDQGTALWVGTEGHYDSDLMSWWDASELDGEEGDSVEGLEDLSGYGNDLESIGSPVLRIAGRNGLNTLEFSGPSDLLRRVGNFAGDGWRADSNHLSAYFVLKKDDSLSTQMLTWGSGQFSLRYRNQSAQAEFVSGTAAQLKSSVPSDPDSLEWMILSFVRNGSSMEVRRNGVVIAARYDAPESSFADAESFLTLMGDLRGQMGEARLYRLGNRPPLEIEQELSDKWSVRRGAFADSTVTYGTTILVARGSWLPGSGEYFATTSLAMTELETADGGWQGGEGEYFPLVVHYGDQSSEVAVGGWRQAFGSYYIPTPPGATDRMRAGWWKRAGGQYQVNPAYLWYDASQISGGSDGDAVTGLENLGSGGSQYDLGQVHSLLRPVLKPGAKNGLTAIQFTGNQNLTASVPGASDGGWISGGGGLTFLAVVQNAGDNSTLFSINSSGQASPALLTGLSEPNELAIAKGLPSSSDAASYSADYGQFGLWSLWVITMDPVTHRIKAWVNGVKVFDEVSSAGDFVGAVTFVTTGYRINGLLGEAKLWQDCMAESELSIHQAALAEKWAIRGGIFGDLLVSLERHQAGLGSWGSGSGRYMKLWVGPAAKMERALAGWSEEEGQYFRLVHHQRSASHAVQAWTARPGFYGADQTLTSLDPDGASGVWGSGDGVYEIEWTNLDGIVAHWDAGESFAASPDGTAVASWIDQVDGKDLVQATGANQPVVASASTFTGMPVVRFDGTNDRLTVTNEDLELLGDFSAIVVFRSIGSTADQRILSTINSGNGWDIHLGNIFSQTSRSLMVGTNAQVTGNVLFGKDEYCVAVVTRQDGLLKVRLNGVEGMGWSGSSHSDSTAHVLTVGGRGSGNYFAGDLAQISLFDRALSTQECEALEAGIASRWGVLVIHPASSLPGLPTPPNDYSVRLIAESYTGLADNDLITTQWTDQSGNARHFTRPAGGTNDLRLRLGANGIGGLPAISFPGSSYNCFHMASQNLYSTWFGSSAQQVTCFVVSKHSGLTTNRTFLSTINGGSTLEFSIIHDWASTPTAQWSFGGRSGARLERSLASSADPAITTVYRHGTTLGWRENGVSLGDQTVSATYLNSFSANLALGAATDFTTNPFSGLISEVLIFPRKLREDEIRAVEAALAAKYSITI